MLLKTTDSLIFDTIEYLIAGHKTFKAQFLSQHEVFQASGLVDVEEGDLGEVANAVLSDLNSPKKMLAAIESYRDEISKLAKDQGARAELDKRVTAGLAGLASVVWQMDAQYWIKRILAASIDYQSPIAADYEYKTKEVRETIELFRNKLADDDEFQFTEEDAAEIIGG